MAKFSKRSKDILSTCHIDLQLLCNESIKLTDFSILCGYRGEQEQNRLLDSGNSNAAWPLSKHNQQPSFAVDIAPYPIDFEDIPGFKDLALTIFSVASELEIGLIWGGHFNNLKDYGHFELIS